jgi:hypothetical protein
VVPISIRPWSGLIDFERFTVFHASGSAGGRDCSSNMRPREPLGLRGASLDIGPGEQKRLDKVAEKA